MLDDNDEAVRTQETANDLTGRQTLLDIQERGWLVEHVDVSLLHTHSRNGKTLQLSSREEVNVTVPNLLQFCGGLAECKEDIHFKKLTKSGDNFFESRLINLTPSLELMADTAFCTLGLDCFWDLIHILRLGHRLEVILQNLGKVVLQLRTSEMLQDLLPIRRVVISAQVGLLLAGKNLQCRTLSNTVRSHQSKHLTRSWEWKSVDLETVGAVAMRDLSLEVGGQVDNVDGVEWALLGTDTASNTQSLGNEGDFAGGVDFNAELA